MAARVITRLNILFILIFNLFIYGCFCLLQLKTEIQRRDAEGGKNRKAQPGVACTQLFAPSIFFRHTFILNWTPSQAPTPMHNKHTAIGAADMPRKGSVATPTKPLAMKAKAARWKN